MTAGSLGRAGFQGQQIFSPSYPEMIESRVQGQESLYGEHVGGLGWGTGHGSPRLSRQTLDVGFHGALTPEGPLPRVRLEAVPVIRKPEEGSFELFRAAEAAVAQNPPLEKAKPNLDLIDPGGVQRGIDEVKSSSVPLVEDLPAFATMGVEVVPDHIDRSCRIAFGYGLHERQKIGGGPGGFTAAHHVSSPSLEGGQQGPRPVTPVFELKAAGLAPTGSLSRIPALQRLDPALFVDTKDGCALRRLQIKLADPFDLWLELRIWAMKPKSHPVRAQMLRVQNPLDLATAQVKARFLSKGFLQAVQGPDLTKLSFRALRTLTGQFDHFTARRHRHHRGTSTPGTVFESIETRSLSKSLAPFADGLFAAADAAGNRGVAQTASTKQDDLSPHHLPVRVGERTRQGLQLDEHTSRHHDLSGLGTSGTGSRRRRSRFDTAISA